MLAWQKKKQIDFKEYGRSHAVDGSFVKSPALFGKEKNI